MKASSSSSLSGKDYKRVPLIQKSLSVVLASLQGEGVKIELKNDKEIYGVIETVGHGMDMRLICNDDKKKSKMSQPSISRKREVMDTRNENEDENFDKDDEEYSEDVGDDMDDFNLNSTLLRGDSIRFVHIPPHINITSHLSQYMRRFESRNFKKIKIVDRKKLPRIEGDMVINMTSSSAESAIDLGD